MNTRLATNSNILTLGMAGLVVTTGQNALAIETPSYRVALKQGVVEFRWYESYVVAETIITGADGYYSAARDGFRRLFNYISGANLSAERSDTTAPVQQTSASARIAMTAPVLQLQIPEGWIISFVIPDQYTLSSAPIPTDERVTIDEVPAGWIAALKYRGRWTETNLEKHRDELTSSLAKSNIEYSKKIQSAFYNSPYSLPFLRRNEILVPVEKLPSRGFLRED